MRRLLPGVVLAILALSAVAVAQSVVSPENLENCIHVAEHDKVLCDLVEATTTTTSTPDTTTTTETTTTTAPTTTTTTGSDLVIPPTQPYPPRGTGFVANGGYHIVASNAETGTIWWSAPYHGAPDLPYDPEARWIAGDREGYRCGYGFLEDAAGEIVGRFAFVRPPDQAYGKVNDTYMDEGQRYLDGTPTGQSGGEISEEDCTDVLSDIDYEGACRPVDERPRVGFFDEAGNVLDIRDYTHTNANNVVFNLHSVEEDRVAVIACEDGLVGMIVYYQALYGGQVAVDFEGVGPFAP